MYYIWINYRSKKSYIKFPFPYRVYMYIHVCDVSRLNIWIEWFYNSVKINKNFYSSVSVATMYVDMSLYNFPFSFSHPETEKICQLSGVDESIAIFLRRHVPEKTAHKMKTDIRADLNRSNCVVYTISKLFQLAFDKFSPIQIAKWEYVCIRASIRYRRPLQFTRSPRSKCILHIALRDKYNKRHTGDVHLNHFNCIFTGFSRLSTARSSPLEEQLARTRWNT